MGKMLRRLLLLSLLVAGTSFAALAQSSTPPDAPTPQPQTMKTPPAAQPDPSDPASRPDWKPNPDDEVEKKSMGQRMKDQVTAPVCINGHCVGGKSKPTNKDESQGPGPSEKPPRSDEDKRSLNDDGESSSRSTIGDISPPKDDVKNHPESVTGMEKNTDDVAEMKKWDPHRAGKSAEVGDYYFGQKNYIAARSRYEEALEWKDNYADAMYKLAVSDEKIWAELAKDVRRNPLLEGSPSNFRDEARRYYELYLKTLPSGEHAQEAKDAIARLK
jgi:hypothetical protein